MPAPKPMPGRVLAAQLLGEVVVPPTAADRRLGADRLVDELERRPRVVVETADERRHEAVGDAERVEIAAHRLEVLLTGGAQRLADRRRIGEQRRERLVLRVEHPQRRGRSLLARLVVEVALVLVEPALQPLEVGRPALSVADRVELELVARRRSAARAGRRTARSARRRSPDRRSRWPRPRAASARGSGRAAAPRSATSAPRCRASPAAARGTCRARGTHARSAPWPRAAASASGRRGPRTCTSPSGRRPSRRLTCVRRPRCPRTPACRSAGSRRGGRRPPPLRSPAARPAAPREGCRACRAAPQTLFRSSARNGLLDSSSPSVVGGPWPE